MNPQEQLKLEKKIQKTLAKYLKPSDKILLAISGGPDSIFLFHQLQKFSTNLYLVHLNHQLRNQANQEEAYIKTLHPKEKTFTKKHQFTQFTEEKGRLVRYRFFHEIAEKISAKFILTAHHADDNLETILLNFTRGTGIKGLSGMEIQNQTLLRPLLDIDKIDILNYLDNKKIKYFKDSTNQNLKHTRNFLRHQIIPHLKKINPNLTTTIQKNTTQLREIKNYLENQAQEWLNQNPQLPIKKLQQLHPALFKQIILTTYQTQIGNTQNIHAINLEEITHLITNNIGNKQKKIGKLIFFTKNGKLRVQKKIA